MKEFHIISTGVSLLTNAQKEGIFPAQVKVSDEDFWRSQLNNPERIHSLYSFLRKDPQKYSAELNTFYRSTEGKNPSTVEVYLVGTKTASNELVRCILERNLLERGYQLYLPWEMPGYFTEIQYFDSRATAETFVSAFGELLDRLLYIGMKKKKEGCRVLFNPTGGFKAHVILCALAGFLTESEVYYMNEEFQSLIYFPHLFYIPKGREIELLRMLSSRPAGVLEEPEGVMQTYAHEIDRLRLYHLIDLEKVPLSSTDTFKYRIHLRPTARLFLR